MTLTFELDLDSIKMNQYVNYLGQRCYCPDRSISAPRMIIAPSIANKQLWKAGAPLEIRGHATVLLDIFL